MALDAYLQRTQLLLDDPAFTTYNDGDLTSYINTARGQIAGETRCIRVMGTLAVSAASQKYAFSAINLGGAAGVQGILNVQQINYEIAQGQKPMHARAWPYFQTFILGKPVPKAGPPSVWSQYAQGAAGSIYVNFLDGAYTLACDTVCYPAVLTIDSDPEAIPYQWTDAIPYYAAYLAAISKRDKDLAEAMWGEYQKFAARGRSFATPDVLPGNFAQAPDKFMQNRLGISSPGGQ